MSLEQTIDNDLKVALKAKDEIKVSTLRMLRSTLKNLAIEKRKPNLEDDEVIIGIKRELKKRQDSIAFYEQAKRDDLLSKEKAEAEILAVYLPPELSADDIKKIIDEVIAQGHQGFGAVMKEVMNQSKGQADGKLVQQLVKEKLAG